MRIIINTASTFEGGAVQSAVSIIEEYKALTDHDFHVILGQKLAYSINKNDFPPNFHFYEIPFRPATNIFTFLSVKDFFRRIERRVNPDIVFTTSGPAYWRPRVPHLCGYNIAHFVYPESAFFKIIPLKKKVKWRFHKIIKKYHFKREGQFYVVQTDDINSRLRLWLKTEKVYTVSNTCSSFYRNPEICSAKLPPRFAEEFRFLIFSTFRPHKNLKILNSIVELLPESYKKTIRFITTIPQKDYEVFFSAESKSCIYNAGPVKISEGPSLYKECDATFLPTLLECFSATYAESMAMEKPIVTSDLTFARSVCKDAALYFDPLDPSDAINKIIQIAVSAEERTKLIINGIKRLSEFGTASDRANSYIMLCQKILSKSN